MEIRGRAHERPGVIEAGRWVRFGRAAAVGLSVVLLVILGPWELSFLTRDLGPNLGGDYVFFRAIASRWLETGALYLPHQLTGPYNVELQVDNLYPPHALLLFVPFTVLPAILWWVIPLVVTGYVLVWLRPSIWAWPILALLVIWPKTLVSLVWGNTDMWVMAAIAGGIRWGWPALFVTVKPVFALFALVGVRRRSWWFGGVALGALSLLMLPLWFDYVSAIRNMWLPADYSIRSLPILFIPIVAWLARAPSAQRPDPTASDLPSGLPESELST
jgi:hypothetical protein